MRTGKIYLKDLVKNKNYKKYDLFYIELKPKFKKQLYQELLKKSKTITSLSKRLNIKFTRLWDQLTRVPISLEILKKLSDYLTKHDTINLIKPKQEKIENYLLNWGLRTRKRSIPT